MRWREKEVVKGEVVMNFREGRWQREKTLFRERRRWGGERSGF